MSTDSLATTFLQSAISRYNMLKKAGEKALAQVTDEDLHWMPNAESNSIAVNVQHLHGNMVSRWTDFLTTDGEKDSRDRDGEFEPKPQFTRQYLMQLWEEGWQRPLTTLARLQPEDLTKIVTIRGEELAAVDVILRELSHYGWHVGQIAYLARMRRGPEWQTLSIAKGQSKSYRPQNSKR